MTTSSRLSERHVEALHRAQQHWQTRRQAGETPAAVIPTVAVAREAGAPGTSVAHEVGARLGWPVYDHELLEQIAKEMGLRVNLLESIDERRQNWMLEALEAFAEAPYVSENSYVRHLIQTVLSLGAHGQCIIVGRGAAQILPAATTLRVRLIGALPDRIASYAQRFGLAPQDAARKVEEINRDRTAFIKDHFQKDPADPLQYDLILNISRWSVSECADLIVRAVHQFQDQLARPRSAPV